MCCCNNGINMQEDFTVYGAQFTTSKEYGNQFLKGRYRLYMRGLGFLTKDIEWEPLPDGGFKIKIAGFNVTPEAVFSGQFY